jgi:hypothetical protein
MIHVSAGASESGQMWPLVVPVKDGLLGLRRKVLFKKVEELDGVESEKTSYNIL